MWLHYGDGALIIFHVKGAFCSGQFIMFNVKAHYVNWWYHYVTWLHHLMLCAWHYVAYLCNLIRLLTDSTVNVLLCPEPVSFDTIISRLGPLNTFSFVAMDLWCIGLLCELGFVRDVNISDGHNTFSILNHLIYVNHAFMWISAAYSAHLSWVHS